MGHKCYTSPARSSSARSSSTPSRSTCQNRPDSPVETTRRFLTILPGSNRAPDAPCATDSLRTHSNCAVRMPTPFARHRHSVCSNRSTSIHSSLATHKMLLLPGIHHPATSRILPTTSDYPRSNSIPYAALPLAQRRSLIIAKEPRHHAPAPPPTNRLATPSSPRTYLGASGHVVLHPLHT